MTLLNLFMRGKFGLLKTFFISHVVLIFYFICAEIIASKLTHVRGEFENPYMPIYFATVLEFIGIFLLFSFCNAIRNYKGKRLWTNLSICYAFFVLQCVLAPLYVGGYLIYLSDSTW